MGAPGARTTPGAPLYSPMLPSTTGVPVAGPEQPAAWVLALPDLAGPALPAVDPAPPVAEDCAAGPPVEPAPPPAPPAGPPVEFPEPADPAASLEAVPLSDPAKLLPLELELPVCVDSRWPRAATTALRDTRVPQLTMTTMLTTTKPTEVLRQKRSMPRLERQLNRVLTFNRRLPSRRIPPKQEPARQSSHLARVGVTK
jgi:hypothetical protein